MKWLILSIILNPPHAYIKKLEKDLLYIKSNKIISVGPEKKRMFNGVKYDLCDFEVREHLYGYQYWGTCKKLINQINDY